MQSDNSLQVQFRLGLEHHQQGRLAEAARIYQSILAANESHFDALHFLGLIACQTGEREKAVALIAKAIQVNPNVAEAHYNLGAILQDLGRSGEALASYGAAIARNPDFAEAHCGHANVLFDLKRLEEALASYDKAIKLRPDYAEAYYNRGNVLFGLGRHDEALASHDKAIACQPNHAQAHYSRGAALQALGRGHDAVASYDKAITFKPHYAEAYSNRGLTLQAIGRLEDALASHDKAIALDPKLAEAHSNRGNVLRDLKRYEEALASCDKAIENRPDYAEAYNNRGIVLQALGRRDEALASYDKAIALNPAGAEAYSNRGTLLRDLRHFTDALADHDRAIARKADYAEAYSNRGVDLQELKRLDEALASYDKAIALRPGYAEAHKNRAHAELLAGQLARGWRDHEWRKKAAEPSGNRTFAQPLLTSLAEARGKTILVTWEQGLGDTIQFCRYLAMLEKAGAQILFAPQAALKSLLAFGNDFIAFADPNDRAAGFDYHLPLLSLPLLFGTTLETIPSDVPYLFADPARIGQWSQRLGANGFRIGICWQGSRSYKNDAARSFPVTHFAGLSKLPGVRLISLYKGDGETPLRAPAQDMTIEILPADFDAGPDAFVDTAAVMASLDLVITSDTAIAHLAGALGVPSWVALPYVPDWRWLLDRPDSPWYPTMRLFRQKTDGDWAGVFAQIEKSLGELIASAAG